MINREIVYERNVTGSFMKIPASVEAGIDECLMLRRKLPGVLPVEKTYVDGGGQYWYNISGKQSLDTYCRVKEVQMEFVEQLIISICGLMERLEWNLIHTNCLMLDPELVFVNNASREFLFTLYPGGTQTVEQEFQILMEYLMKKVDHRDAQATRAVYQIYEQTLEDGYQITDIRSMLLKNRSMDQKDEVWEQPVNDRGGRRRKTGTTGFSEDKNEKSQDDYERYQRVAVDQMGIEDSRKTRRRKEDASKRIKKGRNRGQEKENVINIIKKKFVEWGIIQETESFEKLENVSRQRRGSDELREGWRKREKRSNKQEYQQEVVYPDEITEEEQEPMPVIHPTVCLTNVSGQPKGELRYTGSEGYSDIQLTEKALRIGYGSDADITINRETISQFHASIHKEDDGFYIEDLNSTNGTFVNEEPLAYKEQRKLNCNDIVQFADIRYRFC